MARKVETKEFPIQIWGYRSSQNNYLRWQLQLRQTVLLFWTWNYNPPTERILVHSSFPTHDKQKRNDVTLIVSLRYNQEVQKENLVWLINGMNCKSLMKIQN